MTVHGFRLMALDILKEMGYARDLIESQLAREDQRTAGGPSYPMKHLAERRRMLQELPGPAPVQIDGSPGLSNGGPGLSRGRPGAVFFLGAKQIDFWRAKQNFA